MTSLKMFTDDYEWVIALSPADATAVCRATTGETPTPYDLPDEERWEELPADGVLKMWMRDGKVCEIGDGVLTEMTNREWCERFGRGYVGGTEV